MLAFLALVTSVFAADPSTVVDSNGNIPGMTVSDHSCDNAHVASCLEIINDGENALQIGTSFVGPSGQTGVEVALVKVRGKRQCVLTAGPNGTRCVFVLAPGQHGWVKFPSSNHMVTITVTQWEMDGLATGRDDFIPGTAIPAYVLGDEKLIRQENLAMMGKVNVIPKDFRVEGNNTLHIKY